MERRLGGDKSEGVGGGGSGSPLRNNVLCRSGNMTALLIVLKGLRKCDITQFRFVLSK